MRSFSLGPIIAAIFLAGSVAVLSGCIDDGGSNKKPKAVSVKIIHTNDHHSYLDSSSYDLMIDNVATRVDMGGFARLSTIIEQERNDHSIVVNSGELNGTLYFSLFKG